MKDKLERRQIKGDVRLIRGTDGSAAHIKGYASVFNVVYDVGWFKEVVAPGAFKRTLAEGAAVRCFFNHDDNFILGRTPKTLSVSEDNIGLAYDCQPAANERSQFVVDAIERGDVDGSSFGFVARKDEWADEFDDKGNFVSATRKILDADLYDVSPVVSPASTATSSSVRSLWPHGMPDDLERRSKQLRNASCECECPECQDGDCENCTNEDCEDVNCEGHDRSAQPKAVTKRADDEDLPAAAFLIVGGLADIRSWKLPWKFSTDEKTKAHLQNALARFKQLKGVSEESKAASWSKLVSLCKEHDIEVTEENSAKYKLTAEQFAEFQPDSSQDERRRLRARAILASL
jgi:hypothetical protein